MADPAGRFSIAFDQPTLEWDVTWTALDQLHPSLVAGYTIERGRQYELDRVDVGRAYVTVNDPEGLLDPTNTGSPYAGGLGLQPLLQAAIARRNPVNGNWYTRFRGFVEDYDYQVDPPNNQLTISLVDLMEVVQATELHPGFSGDTPPEESEGQVFFLNTNDRAPDVPGHRGMQIRVVQVMNICGIPDDYYVVFTGNVSLRDTVYSPGESAMTAVQEACDSEFPGVGNV